jgi:hypothetical protein
MNHIAIDATRDFFNSLLERAANDLNRFTIHESAEV